MGSFLEAIQRVTEVSRQEDPLFEGLAELNLLDVFPRQWGLILMCKRLDLTTRVHSCATFPLRLEEMSLDQLSLNPGSRKTLVPIIVAFTFYFCCCNFKNLFFKTLF